MRCGLGACGRAELSGVTELYLCGPMRLLDAARQAGPGRTASDVVALRDFRQ